MAQRSFQGNFNRNFNRNFECYLERNPRPALEYGMNHAECTLWSAPRGLLCG
jgi:hypothetical protein